MSSSSRVCRSRPGRCAARTRTRCAPRSPCAASARTAQDHLPDDPAEMRDRLARHLDTHDVLVLTGGVSMGRFDHVPARAARARRHPVPAPDRAAARPAVVVRRGRPRTGRVRTAGQPRLGAGLPAALRRPGAARRERRSAGRSRGDQTRSRLPGPSAADLLPARPHRDAGADRARSPCPNPTHGSGDFVSLLGTQGFVELPPGPAIYPAGHVAPFYRW